MNANTATNCALATVTALDATQMFLQPVQKSCAGCNGRCAQRFKGRAEVVLSRRPGFEVGDTVELSLAEGVLLGFIVSRFLLPVIAVLIGLGLGQLLGLPPLLAVLLSVLFTGFGLMKLRKTPRYGLRKYASA